MKEDLTQNPRIPPFGDERVHPEGVLPTSYLWRQCENHSAHCPHVTREAMSTIVCEGVPHVGDEGWIP